MSGTEAARAGPGSGGTSIILPLCATLGAMASFQIGAAMAKLLLPAIGALGVAALRLAIGATLLVAILRPWRSNGWRTHPLPLLGLGLAMAGAVLCLYQAIERLPLGVAMALQFLGPLAIAVLRSHRLVDLVWAGLAATGLWILLGVGSVSIRPDAVGVAFALGAAVCWAAYILCGRAASLALGAQTAPLALTLSAALVLPFGASASMTGLGDPDLLPTILLMAVLSSALPFMLEFYALPRLPARTFAVMMSLEPALAVLSGMAILGESLTGGTIAGIALVVAAAAGSALGGAFGAGARTAKPPTSG